MIETESKSSFLLKFAYSWSGKKPLQGSALGKIAFLLGRCWVGGCERGHKTMFRVGWLPRVIAINTWVN